MNPDQPAPRSQQAYFNKRCQEIIDILASAHNAKSAIITEIVADGIQVRAASNNIENVHYADQFIAYNANLFCFRVIDSREPLFVESETQAATNIAYFGYPILRPNGNLFGTICIMDASPTTTLASVKASINKFKLIIERELEQLATNESF